MAELNSSSEGLKPYAVIFAVVMFTAVAQATNLIVNAQLLDAGFKLPFTLMWYTGCTKSALAIPKLIDIIRERRARRTAGTEEKRSLIDSLLSVRLPSQSEALEMDASADGDAALGASRRDQKHQRSIWLMECRCLIFLFICYTAANASALVAVSTVSAGIFSAIFSTQPAFVCLLSKIFLRRSFAPMEAVAIVSSFTGMLFVSKPWSASSSDLRAIGAAVLSPISAAAYTVYFSKQFTHAGWKEVGFVLGKLSILIFVVGGIALVVLVKTGVEPVVWDHSFNNTQRWLFAACTLTGWMFNGGINYAVTITYPLFVSIGGVLSSVFVVVATGLIDDTWPEGLQWLGIVLIGMGFCMLSTRDYMARRKSMSTPSADTIQMSEA